MYNVIKFDIKISLKRLLNKIPKKINLNNFNTKCF